MDGVVTLITIIHKKEIIFTLGSSLWIGLSILLYLSRKACFMAVLSESKKQKQGAIYNSFSPSALKNFLNQFIGTEDGIGV